MTVSSLEAELVFFIFFFFFFSEASAVPAVRAWMFFRHSVNTRSEMGREICGVAEETISDLDSEDLTKLNSYQLCKFSRLLNFSEL